MADLIVFRGIEYELGFSDYTSTESLTGISKKLNEKNLGLSNKEFTYRIVNHWEKNNLLSTVRKDGKGWHKYSIMDKMWIYLIKEMRAFGISLEMIGKVKTYLVKKKGNQFIFPSLEYYISLALINKPVYLIIFSDGQAHPVTDKEFQNNREFSSNTNHVQINLNNILQKIIPEKPLKVKFRENFEPTLDEKKVMQISRLKLFQKAEVVMKDGSMQFLMANSQSEDLFNLIMKKNYQSLIVYIEGEKKTISLSSES